MTRNQVIVQFPFTEQSSLDSFLELEEAFIKLFAQRDPYAEVDGHDVGGRISLPQGFDNALAYDVVRQAAEGLGTYDVRYAFLDQLDHLTG